MTLDFLKSYFNVDHYTIKKNSSFTHKKYIYKFQNGQKMTLNFQCQLFDKFKKIWKQNMEESQNCKEKTSEM